MTPPAEAGLISKEQEIEMGRQTAMQLEAKYGVVQDWLWYVRLPKGCRFLLSDIRKRVWQSLLR